MKKPPTTTDLIGRDGATPAMTAILAEPEPPHVCVYPSGWSTGWSATYGVWMGWSACPIEAAAEVLELAVEALRVTGKKETGGLFLGLEAK